MTMTYLERELLAACKAALPALYQARRSAFESVIAIVEAAVAKGLELEKADTAVGRWLNWTPFYFDGNQAFGLVDSRSEWERIKNVYREAGKTCGCATPAELLEARNCPRESLLGMQLRGVMGVPKFGFVVECCGDQTLGQFFERNGIDPGPL